MNDQFWSWALTLIGVTGFYFAGRKAWWAWYINIANQALWVAYAVVTKQWGFLFGTPIYLAVFIPNAVRWTKAHFSNAKLRDEMHQELKKEIDAQVLHGEGFDGETELKVDPLFIPNFNTMVMRTDNGNITHTYEPRCPDNCYGQLDDCVYKETNNE